MENWIVIFSLGGLIGALLQYFVMNRFAKGRILKIENKNRRFGADPFYHYIEAKDEAYGKCAFNVYKRGNARYDAKGRGQHRRYLTRV